MNSAVLVIILDLKSYKSNYVKHKHIFSFIFMQQCDSISIGDDIALEFYAKDLTNFVHITHQ